MEQVGAGSSLPYFPSMEQSNSNGDEDGNDTGFLGLLSNSAVIEHFRTNYHLLAAAVTYANLNDSVDEFALVRLGEDLDEFISAAERVS